MTVTCSRSPGNMSEEERVRSATVKPAAKEHVMRGGGKS